MSSKRLASVSLMALIGHVSKLLSILCKRRTVLKVLIESDTAARMPLDPILVKDLFDLGSSADFAAGFIGSFFAGVFADLNGQITSGKMKGLISGASGLELASSMAESVESEKLPSSELESDPLELVV